MFKKCSDDKPKKTTSECLKTVNGWLAVIWALNLPVIVALYYIDRALFDKISILYLAIVSIWANWATHGAAWISGRVEVKAEKKDESPV